MKFLYFFLILTCYSCKQKQNNMPFSIGNISIGQKIDDLKDFKDFRLIPDTIISEFDSIYTIPKFYINKEFGTVENLELTIERRRVFSIHFKSGQFTNREKIKYHFDTTLVYQGRSKDSISDFYNSKNEKPIYAYISYFDNHNLYHYTDEVARLKYREQQVKEISEKYDADLKKYQEKNSEK